MDRLATILANFRRRDDIRDFIDGLEDSECWPYPDGESRPIAPTPEFCECCGESSLFEVVLRKDKIEELTHLFLTNVYRYHALAPFNRGNKHEAPLTDVSIELCPEEGPGAYAVSYKVVDKAQRRDAPCLNLRDVATIRSAFMHRYEWVINKFHSVKEARRDAWEKFETNGEILPVLGGLRDDPMESGNEVPLSEEEDHDALQPDSDCSCEDAEDRDEDDPVSDVDFYLNVHTTVKAARSSSPVTQDEKPSAMLGCEQAYGPAAIMYNPDIPQSSYLGTTVPSSPL
ncbi:hypothetical protein MBLNU13_g05512t1 [Cladosporium sp. NU13]